MGRITTLKETLATGYLFSTGATNFALANAHNLQNFTFEVAYSGWSYPAAQNDSLFKVQSREDASGAWQDIDGTVLLIADAAGKKTFRVTGLTAREVSIFFNPVSADAGTIDTINLTASDNG